MRICFALLFAVTVPGGIGAYIRFADSITPEPIDLSETSAAGQYSIDITLTFDAELSFFSAVDPFSLQVKFRDKTLLESNQSIPAGTPLLIENVPDVKAGKNEFWVYASPGDAGISSDQFSLDAFAELDAGDRPAETTKLLERAVRVRIFASGNPFPVAEQTLWSDSGGAVQGTIELLVDKPELSRQD